MADSHFGVNGLDGSRARGQLRRGFNPAELLKVQKEIDRIKKISTSDAERKRTADKAKEAQRKKDGDLIGYKVQNVELSSDFGKKDMPYVRKTDPHFTKDYLNKSIAVKKQDPGTLPTYNPLDKDHILVPGTAKTKKSPFHKEKTVTTQAMQKPHVQPMGVTPARSTGSIQELNVRLQGKPAVPPPIKENKEIQAIQQANKAKRPSTTIETDNAITEPDKDTSLSPVIPPDAVEGPPDLSKKPAILGTVGTIAPVRFTSRVKKETVVEIPKKKTKFRSKKSATKSKQSSLYGDDTTTGSFFSDELDIDSLSHYTRDSPTRQSPSRLSPTKDRFGTTIRSGSALSRHSSVTSNRSATELLQEAKDIVSQDNLPRKPDPSERRMSRRASERRLGAKVKIAVEEPIKERSVDDIISSLKAAREGKGTQSEADIKIQEIMNRVMSRTNPDQGKQSVATSQSSDGEEADEEVDSEEDGETPQDEALPEINVESATDVTSSAMLTQATTTPQDLSSRDEEAGKTPPRVKSGDLTNISEGGDANEATATKPSKVAFQEEVFVVEDEAQEMSDGEVDLEQAWQDLHAPMDVRYEEIMNIEGEPQMLGDRKPYDKADKVTERSLKKPVVQSSSVSFLSTWAPQEQKVADKTGADDTIGHIRGPSIHHFCTVPVEIALPSGLQQVTRMYHTPSKYAATKDLAPQQKHSSFISSRHFVATSDSSSEANLMEQRQHVRSAAARRILEEAEQTGSSRIDEGDENLETWEKRAQQVFDEEAVEVVGQALPIMQSVSRLYWNPAPPKMDLPSNYIQSTLFPEFQGTGLGHGSDNMTGSIGDAMTDRDSVDTAWDEGDMEDKMLRNRILSRQYKSTEDLSTFGRAKLAMSGAHQDSDAKTQEGSPSCVEENLERLTSMTGEELEKERQTVTTASDIIQKFSITGAASEIEVPVVVISDDELFASMLKKRLRRNKSMPNLGYDETDEILILPTDFQSCMEEVERQQKQIEEAKEEMRRPKTEIDEAAEDMESEGMTVPGGLSIHASSPDPDANKLARPTLAEQAREAGLKYVLYPKGKKKKKGKRKPLDPYRLEQIEAFLKQKSNRIMRRVSFSEKKKPVEYELRVPRKVRSRRRDSLPGILDFHEFLDKQEYEDDDAGANVREFVRDVWDDWFDEVFPPTEAAHSRVDTDDEDVDTQDNRSATKRRSSLASTALEEQIDNVEPLADTEENQLMIEELEDEVARLTEIIENASGKPSPFDLTRRGAICRKLGKLKMAWDDLNQAILLEPMLLDAYWHRHLLYLLRNKSMKALHDLNSILKINKEHVGAYRSRAEIYREKDDLTMAIVNYTQTIKLNPGDHDAFFKRAQMYEKRGEMLLALEDYREVTRLMPSKTEALFKRAIYQFDVNKNWMQAIKDFTEMLIVEPHNSVARTYRGRACAKQGLYVNAVEDLSAAVHLDPFNSVAFFHRGCLLRKSHPKQALQDFSVSVLLDDGEDNVMAFFHRAILYMDMNRHEDAIADFEIVLKLDKSIAAAHVNLGLIYMTKLENYTKAIQKFGNAIKVDPTYVRALVCRGEAYHKIHDLRNALTDFTRAIHLRPDQQHFYMYRGEILLEMKNLELASFCVQHAAELSHGLGSSPTQQAAVQSFLQNYTEAINILVNTAKVQPSAPLYILLGKTQIKAKKYKEAVESLEKALDFMKPWQEKQEWPKEAAEVYYLIGMCQMEIPNHLKAYEAFNDAIRINAEYPEAFYQRGLTRMKLRQSKGIVDFNRALALNPKLFQAYLSRAAYYGMRGRYSKAIVNCNEAIRMQPTSVRAYLYRGALKYYIQAYKLAIKDLCAALEIDNTCSLAYFNRAVCYHTTKDYGKALRDYGIVLMLGDDNNLKVLINRGLMYFAQKDYRNAKADFSQAAKEDPRDPKIRHTLGLCYHKLNELEKSVMVFSKAIENNAFFLDAYISRGNAFMDYGHQRTHELARHDYEHALHMDPLCLPARVNLAYNMQVCGKYQQAWEQFTACLDINSNYQPALEGRAIVCLQMSDTFAAFLDLNKAIKLSPSAELYTNRGVVNQFMQDHTNAMTDYQSAIKKDSTYSLAYFNAANVYFHNRQFRQALDFYCKTLVYNPKDESAYLNRAITKVLMRDARGALEDFQQAIKLSPLSAHVYFNRGNLYTSLRRYQLAEKDYTEALTLQPDDPLVHKRRAEVRGKLGLQQEAILDYKRAIQIQSNKHPKAN